MGASQFAAHPSWHARTALVCWSAAAAACEHTAQPATSDRVLNRRGSGV